MTPDEAKRNAAALVRAFIAADLEGICSLVDEDDPSAMVCGVLVSWLVVSHGTDLPALDALMASVLSESP